MLSRPLVTRAPDWEPAMRLRYHSGSNLQYRMRTCRLMTHEMRPVIGITTRIELETDRFYLSRHYSEAVEAAGGVPLMVPLIPHSDYLKQVIARVDGVLLPGSDSDVDPLRYGRDPHPQLGSVHPVKDETDLL